VAFGQSPEGRARKRIDELGWKSYFAGYGTGEFSAAEQTELDHLRTLYPDPPLDPDQSPDEELEVSQRGCALATPTLPFRRGRI
jgi:hypothetical protein